VRRDGRSAAAALLGLALVLTGCTSDGEEPEAQRSFSPVAPPAVALAGTGELPAPLTVGVVVSSASPRGEGSDDLPLAAGARVAEFRAGRDASQPVRLEVVDDLGTPEGAQAAVQSLLEAGVAGIVYASHGEHVDAGVRAATAAGTAVLLPYDTRPGVATTGAWRTGPSDEQVADVVQELLADRGASRPYVLTGEGVAPAVAALAPPELRAEVSAGSALLERAAAAAASVAEGRADALVVSASASTQAEVLAALQEADSAAPVVLGPDALSPAFGTALSSLSESGAATTAGQYLSVGLPATDVSADEGIAGFLSALRLAAQDPQVKALRGDAAFAEDGAASADVRSHDAVVALVRAALTAGSVEPGAVRTALAGLRLDAADGLAGPPLDFTRPQALGDDGVTVLQATTRATDQRSGVVEQAPVLTWFPVPDAG
jgi:branched-chain amino acid transport system substrate-binding protein